MSPSLGKTIATRHFWGGGVCYIIPRIRGMDTPELHGKCPGEPEAAQAARDHLAQLIGAGPASLSEIRHDKYGGRVDAALTLPSGADAAATMIVSAHARPISRGRVSWCPCTPIRGKGSDGIRHFRHHHGGDRRPGRGCALGSRIGGGGRQGQDAGLSGSGVRHATCGGNKADYVLPESPHHCE